MQIVGKRKRLDSIEIEEGQIWKVCGRREGGGRERLKRVNEVGDGRLDLVEAQSRRRSGSRLRRALSAPQNTWESIASSSSILEHGRRVKAGCSGERCVECNGRAAGCSSLSLSLSPRPAPPLLSSLFFPPLSLPTRLFFLPSSFVAVLVLPFSLSVSFLSASTTRGFRETWLNFFFQFLF